MTFLAPVYLAAGAAVAAAIVLLHFLARRRPRAAMLPTARFVPDRPARWPSRAPRPTDWILLTLRVGAVAAMAAAFAQPVRQGRRSLTTRIVLVDRSRDVANERAMRDSALAVFREGDVVIAFDTIARVVAPGAREGLSVLTRSAATASLSVALIAAERAAGTIRSRADSIEVALVSPLAAESWDNATAALRARWAGRMRLISVPRSRGDTGSHGIELRMAASDPVHAAAAPFLSRREARARIVRAPPLATDSTWATGAGHVLVSWPSAADSPVATAEAVVAPGVVLAAPLVRRTLDNVPTARVIARFSDGLPAIIERGHGDGCIRDVGFDLPAAGDVPLRESARRLVAVVTAPCDGDAPPSAMSVARLDSLRGSGPLLAASALPRSAQTRSAATSWLLIASAVLLLAEVAVRRRAVRA